MNDLRDLEGVPARLVSGFPNLRFVHARGALVLSTTLDQFLSELGSDPDVESRIELERLPKEDPVEEVGRAAREALPRLE